VFQQSELALEFRLMKFCGQCLPSKIGPRGTVGPDKRGNRTSACSAIFGQIPLFRLRLIRHLDGHHSGSCRDDSPVWSKVVCFHDLSCYSPAWPIRQTQLFETLTRLRRTNVIEDAKQNKEQQGSGADGHNDKRKALVSQTICQNNSARYATKQEQGALPGQHIFQQFVTVRTAKSAIGYLELLTSPKVRSANRAIDCVPRGSGDHESQLIAKIGVAGHLDSAW
jgi:hypothetical protein